MFKTLTDAIRFEGWRLRLVRATTPRVYYRPFTVADAALKTPRPLSRRLPR